MSRYGDDPVHTPRHRENRRNVARLLNVIAVRAAADSGVPLVPAAPPAQPHWGALPVIPQQRSTSPQD